MKCESIKKDNYKDIYKTYEMHSERGKIWKA